MIFSFSLQSLIKPEYFSAAFGIMISGLVFILLIILYWLIINKIKHYLDSKIKGASWISWKNIILTWLGVILTVFTTILVFIDNLGSLVTSLSLISAALVFALQDYVACFISWVYIELTRQYKVGDIINIGDSTDRKVINGVVSQIGIFRTTVKERFGGDTFDRERPTGKVVRFPNNFIFKFSITNSTVNNRVVFHSTKITITYESDYKLAKVKLEEVAEQKFLQMKKNHIHYFGENIEIEDLDGYKPKVYTLIENSGISFTIWFACRLGLLRQVIDEYTFLIMDTLAENDLHLAYETIRVADTIMDDIAPKSYKNKASTSEGIQSRQLQKSLIQIIADGGQKTEKNYNSDSSNPSNPFDSSPSSANPSNNNSDSAADTQPKTVSEISSTGNLGSAIQSNTRGKKQKSKIKTKA